MGESRNKTLENRTVDIKTKELIDAIHDSEEYNDYLRCRAAVMEDSNLYARICDYRRRNFELQNMDVNDNMFDEVMRFQMENADLRRNELANAFLKAELSVCRLLQDLGKELVDCVDIDLEFLRN